jgi:hypothetical protein
MRLLVGVVALFGTFLAADVALACKESLGEGPTDKKVARKICAVLKGDDSILLVSVKESILYLDISPALYREMRADRPKGEDLVRLWITGMQKESRREGKSVTVWVYVDRTKSIEGQVSILGEKKVKWLLP